MSQQYFCIAKSYFLDNSLCKSLHRLKVQLDAGKYLPKFNNYWTHWNDPNDDRCPSSMRTMISNWKLQQTQKIRTRRSQRAVPWHPSVANNLSFHPVCLKRSKRPCSATERARSRPRWPLCSIQMAKWPPHWLTENCCHVLWKSLALCQRRCLAKGPSPSHWNRVILSLWSIRTVIHWSEFMRSWQICDKYLNNSNFIRTILYSIKL